MNSKNADKENDNSIPPLNEIQRLVDEARVNQGDKRNRDRYPICCTLQLIPIDEEGHWLLEETVLAIGRDLSTTGIGFSKEKELAHHRALISFNDPNVGRFAVEVQLVWSRPTPIGLYDNGCRLIRKVDGHDLHS